MLFRSRPQAVSGLWMIGDNSITDIASARVVGLRAVLVHRADSDQEPRALIDATTLVLQAMGAEPPTQRASDTSGQGSLYGRRAARVARG